MRALILSRVITTPGTTNGWHPPGRPPDRLQVNQTSCSSRWRVSTELSPIPARPVGIVSDRS